MAANDSNEASLIWLEALKGEDAPSSLKRTVVTREGKVLREETLDSDVCTCCPTQRRKDRNRIAGSLSRPHPTEHPRHIRGSLHQRPLVAPKIAQRG